MRGLKYAQGSRKWVDCSVALYTSAWIEIAMCSYFLPEDVVALYTSAWIEIRCDACLITHEHVALYTSAWIEIATVSMN